VVQTVGLLARPLVERAGEEKVRRFFRTVARVSAWAHDRPVELAAALDRHPELPDAETLAAFRALLLDGQPPSWAEAPFHLLAVDGIGPVAD
jgi:ABC-type nitrate/sulfonate/bicarbonate transport system substrate-binding protein